MEEDKISLRQPQHLKSLMKQLAEQNFAEKFGDLKLVFSDGEFCFYKLLLGAANSEWRKMLGDGDVDLVILKDTTAKEFFDSFEFIADDDRIQDDPYCSSTIRSDGEEFKSDEVIFGARDEEKIKIEITEVTEITNIYDPGSVKTELNSSQDEGRVLGCISSDFSWPAHLQAPNFHSMNWRTNSEAFEIMGNKSIYSLLKEKCGELPEEALFSVEPTQEHGETMSGIFRLKDFVNGGAYHSLKVFLQEGAEDAVSLASLLSKCGFQNEKEIIQNSLNVNIYLEPNMKNLKELTDGWKKYLIADTQEQELSGGSKFNKDVLSWLRSQAVCSQEEAPICMYCGFICYDQSPRGDWSGHMRRHLYRKRKCKKCCTGFLAGEDHHCQVDEDKVKSRRSFNCSEPGCIKTYTTKERLVLHLKKVHRIIEKVVTMRQCMFCSEMVPDLHSHYMEAHKNEVANCKFCDKTFTNPTKYKQHIATVHIRKYSGFCEICQKDCASLMKHNIQVHSSKSFPCDHCEKVFKHEKSLEDHMKSVNGTWDKKQCPECSNFYINVSDHIRRFHRGYKGRNKRLFCGSCKKQILQELYEEHKLTCFQSETICHICSASVKNIENHLAQKHKISRIQCGLCETKATVMGELNIHLETSHFPEIIKELGFTGFSTEDRQERELIAMKVVECYASLTSDNKHQCQFCYTETVTKTQILTHMKYHLGYNFKRGKEAKIVQSGVCQCPQCGKVMKNYQIKTHKCKVDPVEVEETLSFFDPHIQVAEVVGDYIENEDIQVEKKPRKKSLKVSSKEEVRLPCDQCDRVFQRIANLRKHVILVHENDNKVAVAYTCEICLKEFTMKASLKKHKMCVHDKVKFPCDQCDHQASDPSNLNNHKKTKHENKKFPCDQCDFISTQSSNLNAHKKAKHSSSCIMVS